MFVETTTKLIPYPDVFEEVRLPSTPDLAMPYGDAWIGLQHDWSTTVMLDREQAELVRQATSSGNPDLYWTAFTAARSHIEPGVLVHNRSKYEAMISLTDSAEGVVAPDDVIQHQLGRFHHSYDSAMADAESFAESSIERANKILLDPMYRTLRPHYGMESDISKDVYFTVPYVAFVPITHGEDLVWRFRGDWRTVRCASVAADGTSTTVFITTTESSFPQPVC